MSISVSHVSLPLFVASLRSCGCTLVFLSLRCTSDHSCCCSRLCLRHGLEPRLRQTSDCITSSSVPFTCHRLFIIFKKRRFIYNLKYLRQFLPAHLLILVIANLISRLPLVYKVILNLK